MPRSSVTTASTFIVERASETLPQSTQTPYFTVSGRVLVTQLVGEITVVAGFGTTNTKLVANPTVGADVDLCATNNIELDAVGTMYTITSDFSDAMVATTSGAVETSPTANSRFPIIVAAGTIDLSCSASITGETKWTLHYIPLDTNSSVTTA